MDLIDPCAWWLVFGFARVQISRFRQNRQFSSVILPLCFLTVTAPVGVLGYLVYLLMVMELVPFAEVISIVYPSAFSAVKL